MAPALPIAMVVGVLIPCFGLCGYGLQYSEVAGPD